MGRDAYFKFLHLIILKFFWPPIAEAGKLKMPC